MSIGSAIVLYAVTWFMTLFVVLPIRLETQGDRGEIVAGTHAGAPADPQIGRRVWLTTLWATPIWAVICAVILSGLVTDHDIDLLRRFGPDAG